MFCVPSCSVFVFANFNNVIQVLVMSLNLRVYLVDFCLYRLCIYSLILCISGCFVFFNFRNVLEVPLNLRVFLFFFVKCCSVFLYLLGRKEIFFIDSFRQESLSKWCTLKCDNGQACPSITMDGQHLPTHLRTALGICLLTWGLNVRS